MYKEEVDHSNFAYIFRSLFLQRPLAFILLLFFSLPIKASFVDAKFKLSRKLSASQSAGSTNEVATLYKDFLSKSIYSRCRWLPSDSQYLTMTSQKCGRLKGTLLAFSRFMTEHDADKISEGIVNDDGHIRFLSFGRNCDLL